jgi:hypothetical protein
MGIQSHMFDDPWPLHDLWSMAEAALGFGVPVHFTEVSVSSGVTGGPSTPEGEKLQAEYVEKFYGLLFSHPVVESILWWSFSDYHPYVSDYGEASPGLLRYDLTPKPAYDRLLYLFHEKWRTQLELSTDSQGEARFRGFYGDYSVIVTSNDVTQEFSIRLSRTSPHDFLLELEP